MRYDEGMFTLKPCFRRTFHFGVKLNEAKRWRKAKRSRVLMMLGKMLNDSINLIFIPSTELTTEFYNVKFTLTSELFVY